MVANTEQPRTGSNNRGLLAALIIALALIFTGGALLLISSDSPDGALLETTAPVVSYAGRQGADALTLLRENATVETQQYSFGEFVISINDIGSAEDNTHGWILYINGEAAQTGATELITSDSDLLEWRYEEVRGE